MDMTRETFEDDRRLKLNGIIIKHRPVGEYDYIVTILTLERGKISAFAKNARKPGSKLSGNVEPFCYGSFLVYEGKKSMSINEADIVNYFDVFRKDLEKMCYGTMFLELADYYATENSDERDLLTLLYLSLIAISKDNFDNRLVRCIYEIRALVIDGQYPGIPKGVYVSDTTSYAMNYIATSPIKKLFSFKLDDEALGELIYVCKRLRDMFVDKKINSIEMLDVFEVEKT